MLKSSVAFLATLLVCSAASAAEAASNATVVTSIGCANDGWQARQFTVANAQRRLLFKAPAGAWQNGAILVLHGGGGKPEDFCGEVHRLLSPQASFTEMAVAQGFAVFVLDSTRLVTDGEGKVCGKVWDDEVLARDNLDLPYIQEVIQQIVVAQRPAGSNPSIFLAGHSSGGYMAVRAASNLGKLITAFAAISSGDPYGWTRRCDPQYGDRREQVKGAGFDNETGRQIIEVDACQADSFPHERPWGSPPGEKPTFRIFHNDFDGINDRSCAAKVDRQLRDHGFPGESPYIATRHDNRRRLIFHFWPNEYNPEILAFFKRHLAKPDTPGK